MAELEDRCSLMPYSQERMMGDRRMTIGRFIEQLIELLNLKEFIMRNWMFILVGLIALFVKICGSGT